MRRRRVGQQSVVANPVLVGAVTTLVVLVAVFLAYTANNGLPFVPTKQINVQIASGSNLVKGNDVREGGFRIGVLDHVDPTRLPDGSVGALLTLKLDRKSGNIPVDSTIKIRPRSALGLKYVELAKGTSVRNLKDGDTIPLAQTNVPVQFDDLFKLFDRRTREASQTNLQEFGNAFAGRGGDLNVTIGNLPELFRHLEPVAKNLADCCSPGKGLARFFRSLNTFTGVIAPVAEINSRGFTDLAITFEAFSRDPQALRDTIAKSPATLEAGTRSFRAQRPFLNDTAAFSHNLRLATTELRRSLPTINSALEIGAPVLRRSTELNSDLKGALGALRDLTTDPATNLALRGLTATVTTLNPTLRYIGPFVTVCNYWNWFWTFTAEHFTGNDPTGTTERAQLNAADNQTNGVTAYGATEPANGGPANPMSVPQFLHGQPYGAAVNPDGSANCEIQQRGYPERVVNYFPSKFKIALDPHNPGFTGGPLFKTFDDRNSPPGQRALGPSHVPSGETFTAEPQTGAQVPQPGTLP